MKYALVAIALGLATSSAHAAVLDFESIAPGGGYAVIEEDGYRFTTVPSPLSFPQTFFISTASGTRAISAPGIGVGDGAILRRQDNGVFSLTSVDMFTDVFSFSAPYSLFFSSTNAQNVQSSFIVTVPGFPMGTPTPATRVAIDFSSIANAQNIVEFRWSNPATPRLFDNFVVTDAFAPAVPEPATWLSMMLGFGIAGLGLRSRRRRSVVA